MPSFLLPRILRKVKSASSLVKTVIESLPSAAETAEQRGITTLSWLNNPVSKMPLASSTCEASPAASFLESISPEAPAAASGFGGDHNNFGKAALPFVCLGSILALNDYNS